MTRQDDDGEDRAALLADLTEKHGPEIAAVILKDWANEVQGDYRQPRRDTRHGLTEGVKSKRPGGVGVRGRYR